MTGEVKRKGKPALSRNYDKYVELFNRINESDRRSLLVFMQSFNTFELYKAIKLYYSYLYRFEDYIMPLKDLLTSYTNLNSHFINNKSDSMHFARLQSYATEPRSEICTVLLNEFRKKGNEYRKWITEVVKTMSNYSSNVIGSGVNKEGVHYRAAVDMADHLSNLWFVRKVTLFGSVARGEERPDSDIDLAVELLPELGKARRSVQRLFDGIIKEIVDELQEKYIKTISNKKLFNILCTTFSTKKSIQMFEMTGFFEKAIILYERVNPVISIMNSHTVNIDKFYGVIPNAYCSDYNDYDIYYCFFEPAKYQGKYGQLCKTKVVKYCNNKIIFLGIAQLPVGFYAGCNIEIAMNILAVNNDYLVDPGIELNVLKGYNEKLDTFKK